MIMENKINILIVEDHILLAKLLNHQLSEEDNFVVGGILSSVDEMLLFLNQNHVDVILLDLILPNCDGLSILKQLKEIYPKIKVIIITMIEEPEIIYKAVKLGVNGYLTKHTEVEEIRDAINSIMMNETYFCKRSTNILIKAMNGSGIFDLKNKHSINKNELKKIMELNKNYDQYDFTIENNIYAKIEKSEYLSKREKEILDYIIQGYTTKELSEKLFISSRTAETHRKNILQKLGVKSIAGLMKRIYNNINTSGINF
jgi:DNA-binding NarL/FixJ family response regulator